MSNPREEFTPTLLSPVRVGPYTLANRLVMAPMTRSRAGAGEVPTADVATYYQQRASAGLIVTEGSQISPEGVGYLNTPGIHTDAQVEGWQRVTRAVHRRGGKIFLQLWHVGRISHPDLQPGGAIPVAPSAIAPAGAFSFTTRGKEPVPTPRALDIAEIPGQVRQWRVAAQRARDAGFDGVELHGANGYLIDQFLRDGSNHRTDAYGGSIENRTRFLLEVTEAVANVWGADRVGVRLAPTSPFNDMSDSNPVEHFGYAARALDRFGLAYLHAVLPRASDPSTLERKIAVRIREGFTSPLIVNGGYDEAQANAVIESGVADLVAFGVLFLANPDLPERFAERAALNPPDPATFYGGDAHGYIDYPTRTEAAMTATQ